LGGFWARALPTPKKVHSPGGLEGRPKGLLKNPGEKDQIRTGQTPIWEKLSRNPFQGAPPRGEIPPPFRRETPGDTPPKNLPPKPQFTGGRGPTAGKGTPK